MIKFPSRRFLPPPAILLILCMVFLIASCSMFHSSAPDRSLSPDKKDVYDYAYQNRERPPTSPYSGKPPFWYREPMLSRDNTLQEGSALEDDAQPLPEELFEPPEILADDMDRDSLRRVLQNQLEVLRESDPDKEVRLGNMVMTQGWLQETLQSFLALVEEDLPPDEFSRRARDMFVFERVGKGRYRGILFTGYYAPVLEASWYQTEEYPYPLYQPPEDPPAVQLISHHTESDAASPLSTSNSWRRLTRHQIDQQGVLSGKGLEIAWLKDNIDRYFLHIQGSGILKYPDGTTQTARFATANDYKYKGIGSMLVDDGLIELSQGSMQGIKKYLRENPEDIPKYLYRNKRYIFFSLSDELPLGSGGGELVGGRSIATDKRYYPAGGLAFILSRKPVLNDEDINEIERWEAFSRFVVDQDTGNAIRGPGRGDLYFGLGKHAGARAGKFREWGEVYYLVKKDNSFPSS